MPRETFTRADPSKLHMFRHCGPGWRSYYGGYGWPEQFGRRFYRHRTPFGGLMSTMMTLALIAMAISWWRGRRSPFTF